MKLLNVAIRDYSQRVLHARLCCQISTKLLIPLMFPIRGQYWVRDQRNPTNIILLQVTEPVKAEL